MEKHTFRKKLATFLSAVSFLYLFAITFLEIPTANKDNVNIILGFLLGTAISTIIGFYFGDSDKTDKETTS